MKVHELMDELSICPDDVEVVVSRLMTESEFLALEDCGDGGKEVGGTVSAIDINDKVYLYLD